MPNFVRMIGFRHFCGKLSISPVTPRSGRFLGKNSTRTHLNKLGQDVANANLGRVASGGDIAAVACPVGMEKLAARLVDTFIGVSAKIIALGLEQVGGKALAAVRIVKSQRRAESRNGEAFLGRRGNDVAPGALRTLDGFAEE